MTMLKARKMRTTRTTRTRTTLKAVKTMKAMAMAKLTPNLNVSKNYCGRAVRRGEIEALVEKRKRLNKIRVQGKRLRGGGVDVTMLSHPRRARLGIVAQESSSFRGLVLVHDKIRFETGVYGGTSGVQQVLEAYSTMGRAFAGGPPKLDDEPFVGELEEDGVSELQLRRLNDMEIMLIAFRNRLCGDMGCVMASGEASTSPTELCQGVKKYYLGKGGKVL